MILPVVVIIGRPNVGKSTFFNRVTKSRKAITDDEPGVTRDRHYRKVEWTGHYFTLIDTGGFMPQAEKVFDREIREQAEMGIEEADLIIFMVDAHVGPQEVDIHIAKILQKRGKPTLLVVNKADNPTYELDSSAFYSLGLGEPFPISSVGGRNIGDFLDAIIAAIPKAKQAEPEPDGLKVAVLGRPNVGKSSLVNKLLGDDRLIVSDIAGTTRDSIDTVLNYKNQQFVLIDTAGLRRKARVKSSLEFYTTLRTIRALERSEIVLILIEAPEGMIAQDIKIIQQAIDERKGIIVVVNKWDLVEKDTRTVDQFTMTFHKKSPTMKYIPLVFVSALSGQRATKVLELAMQVNEERNKRISTAELNNFINAAINARRPPARKGKFIKFYYVTQSEVAPPTFVFFANYPELLDKSYLRYLENRLREEFGFYGNSIRLKFKKRSKKDDKD